MTASGKKQHEVNLDELKSMSAKLEKFHDGLPEAERDAFRVLIGGTLSGGRARGEVHVGRLWPSPPPPIVPHGHGGGTHLVVGGTGGFTVWVGANGKYVYKPQPDDYHLDDRLWRFLSEAAQVATQGDLESAAPTEP
jgi:hypothetical protein